MRVPHPKLECRRIRSRSHTPRATDRTMAKRVHPDKTPDDRASAAFDALRDAYDLLLDPALRAEHDQVLAREDRAAAARRQHRRAVVGRALQRAISMAIARVPTVAQWAWEHKRTSVGIAVLIYLRFFL